MYGKEQHCGGHKASNIIHILRPHAKIHLIHLDLVVFSQ